MSNLNNLDDLFQSAQDDGLTDDTMNLVISNLNGPTMTGAIGIPLNQLATNEVTLAMNIMDMSGSMHSHANDLIRAYNDDYLGAMAGSTAVDDILVSTIVFDNQVELLHGYVNLGDAPQLNRGNYDPDGTTALYDAVASGMTNMVLYAQQLRQSGVMVRCIIIVYSDGEDNASKQTAASVRRAAHDLLKHEMYTLAYVGFKSGGISDSQLRHLADAIGFPDVLIAGMSHEELRRIFHLASMSTVRVSQGGGRSANGNAGIFA
jgi:hypothetical protein